MKTLSTSSLVFSATSDSIVDTSTINTVILLNIVERLDKMNDRFEQIETRLTIVEQNMEDHRSVSNVSSEILIISNSYPILEILFKSI